MTFAGAFFGGYYVYKNFVSTYFSNEYKPEIKEKKTNSKKKKKRKKNNPLKKK